QLSIINFILIILLSRVYIRSIFDQCLPQVINDFHHKSGIAFTPVSCITIENTAFMWRPILLNVSCPKCAIQGGKLAVAVLWFYVFVNYHGLTWMRVGFDPIYLELLLMLGRLRMTEQKKK
ncbi:hypothetical protein ACJX0J_020980, partial [Zea mays]